MSALDRFYFIICFDTEQILLLFECQKGPPLLFLFFAINSCQPFQCPKDMDSSRIDRSLLLLFRCPNEHSCLLQSSSFHQTPQTLPRRMNHVIHKLIGQRENLNERRGILNICAHKLRTTNGYALLLNLFLSSAIKVSYSS